MLRKKLSKMFSIRFNKDVEDVQFVREKKERQQAAPPESRLPTPGSTKEKRRSLLPSPLAFRKSASKAASPEPGRRNDGMSDRSASTATPTPPPLLPEEEVGFRVGQRVCIAGVKPGVLRFYGRTQFADGYWCGIELDECDGTHNGTVEGQEYFSCQQGYGIFAPSQKVDLLSDKPSKLQQPKASGLKRLSKSRSRSPETCSPSRKASKDSVDAVASESATPQSPRFVSKLFRPKAKGITSSQSENGGLGSKGDRESLSECTGSPKRPSRLPKQSSGLPIKRSQSALEPADVKKYHSSIPKPGSKFKEEKISSGLQQPKSSAPPQSFSLSDLKQARLEGKSVSRAERQVKARSLSHDLASLEGQLPFPIGGLDPKQKDSSHRSSNSSLCSKSSAGSLVSPIPDHLTQGGKRTPVGFGGEAMSEPESDDAEFLTSSNMSHASSLGILPDAVLCENSLVSAGANGDLNHVKKSAASDSESKETTEMMEKDLDHEISGISTPEIDMSGSTISGKDLCSSPDMDDAKPPSEAEVEKDGAAAGEHLATPATTSSESSPDSDMTKIHRDTSKKEQAVHVDQHPRPSRDSSVDSCKDDTYQRSGSKRNSLNLLEEQYPKVMRTSMDLDEVDGCCSNASVEIAKTAVQQYAELMAAAEQERQNLAKQREVKAARRAARRSSQERALSMDSDGSDCEFILHRSASSGNVDASQQQQERSQLLCDLEAGHAKQERPVSMISTGSADTGIVADLPPPGTPNKRRGERPLSLISTSSVDTGYQPDTDSEVGGTLTTNSPLGDDSPIQTRDHPEDELSPRSAAMSLDAAYQETILKFQKAAPAGTSLPPRPSNLITDSGVFSDASTLHGDSENEQGSSSDIDDLMVQQNLLEYGLERMLESVIPGATGSTGREGGGGGGMMRRGSPTGEEEMLMLSPSDEQETPGSSTEEEDMALHEGLQTPVSDIHVPMETIPEQDTPESPELELVAALEARGESTTESEDVTTTATPDLTAPIEDLIPNDSMMSPNDDSKVEDDLLMPSESLPVDDKECPVVDLTNDNKEVCSASKAIIDMDEESLLADKDATKEKVTDKEIEEKVVEDIVMEKVERSEVETSQAEIEKNIMISEGVTEEKVEIKEEKKVEEKVEEKMEERLEEHLDKKLDEKVEEKVEEKLEEKEESIASKPVEQAAIEPKMADGVSEAPIVATEVKPVEATLPDMSVMMAKAEDAPISSSEDTITTDIPLKDTVIETMSAVENDKEQTLRRNCVQGLPPPIEPDSLMEDSIASSSGASPESEINQNTGAATWSSESTPPPEVAITPAEEFDSVPSTATENGVKTSEVEKMEEEKGVVEEMISPVEAQQAQSSVPTALAQGDLICIRDAIPADAIGESAELSEMAIEELIIPTGSSLVSSSVLQFTKSHKESGPIVVKPGMNDDMMALSMAEHDITEKEKASSEDEEKDIVRELQEEPQTENMDELPSVLKEDVRPEGRVVSSEIESVTEHEVLVETLEVTEGPVLRTSTPVSEIGGSDAHQSSAEEPELALSETHSVNTTFTEGESVPLVEIEIVSAEMSESTAKDQGPGEKGGKEKEKEGEPPVDEKKPKKNGTKVTKSAKIEDVAKTDQRKTLRSRTTTLKDSKSRLTTTAKTTTKDNADKSTLKNKVTRPNTNKTSTLKKPEMDKKPATAKVSPRLSNLTKEPPKPKSKLDNTIVVNNAKVTKNNTNMKKVDSSSTLTKRHAPPKSKWDNIMSQIDSKKPNNKTASAHATKTKDPKTGTGTGRASLSTSSSSVTRTARSAPTTPRTGPGTTPRTAPGSVSNASRSPREPLSSRTTAASAVRRASSANAAEAKSKTISGTSSTLRAGRSTSSGTAGRSKTSPDLNRSESRLSNASNGSLAGSRPTSASKPGNRTTASLRRERSPSAGSEASGSSQVSSQGSRTPRSTKEPTPEPAARSPRTTTTLSKRRSTIADTTNASRVGSTDKVETRRSSIATSSRLASKKDGSPSVTDKKISMLPSLEGESDVDI